MLTFTLDIRVAPEHRGTALDTLAGIEGISQKDSGCIQFGWYQHEAEPDRFTLFEQWESQQDLDTHIEKILPLWEEFVPCLADEPRSASMAPVVRAER
ncbi:putative quinol monooxygenase [Streptomyces sp. NPDC001595]|uniref:putative quinol monooxygenase n=1 Tax=Streptomyces sp. NPDC001532 TaxID=3154520 RepID=UPI003318499F